MDTISRSGPDRLTEFLATKIRCHTKTFSWKRTYSSLCVATALTISFPGVQFVASGEYNDVDRFRGKRLTTTGIISVFLGPRLMASRARWSAEVSAAFPVLINNPPICEWCPITGCAARLQCSFNEASSLGLLSALTDAPPGARLQKLRPRDQTQFVRLHEMRMRGNDADAEAVSTAFGGRD
jgi:hypothetical protein